MNEATNTQIAREEAGKQRNRATAELIKSAQVIAHEHGIPDGINGLSAGEYLGRVSFVVSMQRELRVAGENLIATEMLRRQLTGRPPVVDDLNQVSPAASPGARTDPLKPSLATHTTIDLTELPGITVQTVKALKSAGLHSVEDVTKCTDEALLKINGIANPSLVTLRGSIAKYQAGQSIGP